MAMPSTPQALNPVYSYLEISTNQPILGGKAEPEHIDAKDDLLAPFKVHRYSRRLWAALLAEFLGLCIFQIYGGSANDDVAALANGITLAVIVYATCNVSGGHLNPAVSFAQCLTGHMSWSKGGVYALAQIMGGIFGALIESGLMPGVSPGDGSGPGCFTHLKGVMITKTQLFWWECIMTFVLVSVVYATAVTKPGHGSMAPLAIGFTLYASAAVAGPYTGAALNPARVFGPTLVFDCFWDTAFIYITGQLLGGFLAAVLVLPLYGFGQFGSLFDTRIFSWLGLSLPQRFHQVGRWQQIVQYFQETKEAARGLKRGSLRPTLQLKLDSATVRDTQLLEHLLQLPETEPTPFAAQPSSFPVNVQTQATIPPMAARRDLFDVPLQSASPTTFAQPSGSPGFANRVYGNPQLGLVPMGGSRSTLSGLSVTESSRSGSPAPAAQNANEFLPDNWKMKGRN